MVECFYYNLAIVSFYHKLAKAVTLRVNRQSVVKLGFIWCPGEDWADRLSGSHSWGFTAILTHYVELECHTLVGMVIVDS
jgi:hypothetical protein